MRTRGFAVDLTLAAILRITSKSILAIRMRDAAGTALQFDAICARASLCAADLKR